MKKDQRKMHVVRGGVMMRQNHEMDRNDCNEGVGGYNGCNKGIMKNERKRKYMMRKKGEREKNIDESPSNEGKDSIR